ncbi:MAG TPA: MoaD/ThiS family protein [Pirellulaceae bacterium]|jgi:molybdopterin converting factor small subunit
MKVRVQYTGQLRTAIGRSEDEVELPPASTLACLLGHLADQHGADARTHFITPSGKPRQSLLLVVNNEAKSPSDAATTVLQPDSLVVLLPPIAGG